MRWFPLVLFLGYLTLTAAAHGQGRASSFNTLHVDVSLRVEKSPTGADNVNIQFLAKGYPKDLLKSQLDTLGKELGTPVRIGTIYYETVQADVQESFLNATFAVDGLIDDSTHSLKIQPILRAFAGAPAPYTIQGFSIFYAGLVPDRQMVKTYTIANVLECDAKYSAEPFKGTEYRIMLLTQDPAKITFPDRFAEEQPKQASTPSIVDNRALLIGLFIAAGIVVGALVYLALLRTGRRVRS